MPNDAQQRIAAVERKQKAIRKKLDRLDDAFLFERTIDVCGPFHPRRFSAGSCSGRGFGQPCEDRLSEFDSQSLYRSNGTVVLFGEQPIQSFKGPDTGRSDLNPDVAEHVEAVLERHEPWNPPAWEDKSSIPAS